MENKKLAINIDNIKPECCPLNKKNCLDCEFFKNVSSFRSIWGPYTMFAFECSYEEEEIE